MSSKSSRPKPLGVVLTPTNGDIHAHVFENSRIRLARNLFWNLCVDFEPVTRDDEEWSCSLLVDWLTWPVRRWQDIDGMVLGQVSHPELVECSLYLFGEHHWATLRHLRLIRTERNNFLAEVDAVADVDTDGGRRSVSVSTVCPGVFSGIIVIPGSLEPKPATVVEL
jgi:hypothetical protein